MIRCLLVAAVCVGLEGMVLAQTLIHRVDGDGIGDRWGNAVGGGGFDVDGDAIPDFVVGGPYSDLNRTNGGAVRVFSGYDGDVLLQFVGTQDNAYFGSAVAIVGDVTGDGRAEILVGAPYYDAGGTDCGQAYLYSGRDGTRLATFSGH